MIQLPMPESPLAPACPSNEGETPLALAVAMGQTAAARYLLDQGADVALRRQPGGPAPIHRAAACRDPGLLDMLVVAGADVGMPSDTGTPMCWAAGAGLHEAVERLLKLGAGEYCCTTTALHAWMRGCFIRDLANSII
jgi:ankyrin repeat protein